MHRLSDVDRTRLVEASLLIRKARARVDGIDLRAYRADEEVMANVNDVRETLRGSGRAVRHLLGLRWRR